VSILATSGVWVFRGGRVTADMARHEASSAAPGRVPALLAGAGASAAPVLQPARLQTPSRKADRNLEVVTGGSVLRIGSALSHH
jgi:hypothetical protein